MREKGIRKIISLLNRAYGKPSPLRRSGPVDELIRTVLSQNTSDRNSLKAFRILKANFKSWDGLLKAKVGRISCLIRSAGLANIKSRRIKDILAEIKRREGRISLARLKDLSLEEAAAYLRSLKGVGPKTASCVLLFSFAKPAMPVDTHIFRVAKRLGIIARDIDIEEAHRLLSSEVPKDLIYDFHLGIIEHGRRTCRAQGPKCGVCVLYDLCGFKNKREYRRRTT